MNKLIGLIMVVSMLTVSTVGFASAKIGSLAVAVTSEESVHSYPMRHSDLDSDDQSEEHCHEFVDSVCCDIDCKCCTTQAIPIALTEINSDLSGASLQFRPESPLNPLLEDLRRPPKFT